MCSRNLSQSMATSPQSRGAFWNQEWEYFSIGTGYSPDLVKLASGKVVSTSTKKMHVRPEVHSEPHSSTKSFNLHAISLPPNFLKTFYFLKNIQMKNYKDSTNNFSTFFTDFEHFSSIDTCFFSEALESKL